MAAADGTLTPEQAASAFLGLREARETVNNRAAALAWMMWALILTSMAGSLALFNVWQLPRLPESDLAWSLFLLANLLIVGLWAAFGGALQGLIWRAFTLSRPHDRSVWKGPALAFVTGFALVVLNLLLQGPVRWLAGAHTDEEIHHNLGFSMPLLIGGAIVIAVTLVQGRQGFVRRPGVVAGVAAMAIGHLSTFLWVPDLGIPGALLAVAAIPFSFVAVGWYFWRQG